MRGTCPPRGAAGRARVAPTLAAVALGCFAAGSARAGEETDTADKGSSDAPDARAATGDGALLPHALSGRVNREAALAASSAVGRDSVSRLGTVALADLGAAL